MKPLRIVLVSQSYHPVVGGIGEHVRHLGLALRDRGHQVEILTSGPPPDGGELDGLNVVRIGRRFMVPSNGSRASVAFHPLYLPAVARYLRRPVDLIHIHSPLEPFLPWAVLLAAKVPVVGTFHNAGRIHWGYRYFGCVLQRIARRLTVRIAVSRCASAYAGRHFPGRYLIVPNGIDPVRFRPVGCRRPERPRTVLFVGRLEPRKGLDCLLDGVARASGSLRQPIRLIVVGDGSLRGRLLQRAGELGLPLDWRGVVDSTQLPRCYREADLLAAPALHGESFGIVLLEALASGLPVVASGIEGFAELLAGCPAAHLFPAGQPDAFAQRIVGCLSRPNDPSRSFAARRFALSFAWDRVALGAEEVYREALGGVPAQVEQIWVSAKAKSIVRRQVPRREPEAHHA